MKVDYTKIESDLTATLLQILVDRLNELAAIATAMQDPQQIQNKKVVETVLEAFKDELLKIKKKDKKLFSLLKLEDGFIDKFSRPVEEFTAEDWARIKNIKEEILELRKTLCGDAEATPADDEQVTKERKKHINKRFHVKDNWLPLH